MRKMCRSAKATGQFGSVTPPIRKLGRSANSALMVWPVTLMIGTCWTGTIG